MVFPPKNSHIALALLKINTIRFYQKHFACREGTDLPSLVGCKCQCRTGQSGHRHMPKIVKNAHSFSDTITPQNLDKTLKTV